jgi:hypothetical protein
MTSIEQSTGPESQMSPEILSRDAKAFILAIDDKFLDETRIIDEFPGVMLPDDEAVPLQPDTVLPRYVGVMQRYSGLDSVLAVRPVLDDEELPLETTRGVEGPRVAFFRSDDPEQARVVYVGQDGRVYEHQPPQDSGAQGQDTRLGENDAWDLIGWLNVAAKPKIVS